MTWLQRHRFRHYLRNAIWIWPVASMAVAVGVARFLLELDASMGPQTGFSTGAAQTLMATLAASMFTFIVFVSSALLVAVQLASSQLTPRVIAIVFNDPVTKGSLVVFVFSFTMTLAVLARVADTVPLLTTRVAAYSCLASLGVFLFLVDHVGKALRPSGTLGAVSRQAIAVIDAVYPRRISDAKEVATDVIAVVQGQHSSTIKSPREGVVLAFDIPGLVSLAQQADCVIELVPQVGDFVALGDPLFRIYQGGSHQALLQNLYQSVAVGQERTIQQDPAYALRIMVDIASKGLSPAINDPTTAVLALDQIHHLLRELGWRHLDDERIRDRAGKLRLLYRTPDWEDFVRLAVTEIRQFGATSIQIARRLRAMLENLTQSLPQQRTALLQRELQLLHRSIERIFADPEDQALADVSDSQGMGGRFGQSNTPWSAQEAPPS